MSKISKEQIEKIANLARIEITGKEKTRYSEELSEILGYIEKLNRADTSEVSETSQVTGLENVYRKDNATGATQVDNNELRNREKLLKNAPSQKDGYIKTRAVLE